MTKFGFSKDARLLKPSEFDRVFRNKCSCSDASLVLYIASGETESARVGLVVSRKCGNAVKRNRWKRLLREAFRLEQHRLTPGCDFVLIPKGREAPPLGHLRKSLPELVKRATKKMQQRRAQEERA